MTPYKRALDAFLNSPEGISCSEPTSLQAPTSMRSYIENRLKRAFDAGWNAACGQAERAASSAEAAQ